MTTQFHFYRGDDLLGIVEHTDDEFPNHIGVFVPASPFEQIRPLFVAELRLLNANQMDEWRQVRNEIERPGLTLAPIGPGDTVRNPLIHIDGARVWWR